MLAARHLLCAGLLLASSVAGALAKPAYVLSTVNLRAAPGTSNEIITKIPSGSLVDADSCTDGWCAVTWQDKRGFAIQTALDLSGRVPPRTAAAAPPPGPYVIDEGPVYYAPPPYYYRPYWRPYWRPYYRPWRYHYHRW